MFASSDTVLGEVVRGRRVLRTGGGAPLASIGRRVGATTGGPRQLDGEDILLFTIMFAHAISFGGFQLLSDRLGYMPHIQLPLLLLYPLCDDWMHRRMGLSDLWRRRLVREEIYRVLTNVKGDH